MVTIEITEDKLILTMQGMDKFWALRSHLEIPLQHITGAWVDPEKTKGWWRGFKLPGSNIPGVLTAGTFYQDGKRVFWDIHNPDTALVISLQNESYNELVVGVENPELEKEKILAVIGS